MSRLPELLKERRESAGLKPDEVAKRIGKSIRTYQYYEEGKVTPKPNILNKLSNVLKFDLADIYKDAKKLHGNELQEDQAPYFEKPKKIKQTTESRLIRIEATLEILTIQQAMTKAKNKEDFPQQFSELQRLIEEAYRRRAGA